MKKKIPVITGAVLIIVIVIALISQQSLIKTALTLSQAESFSRFNFNAELNIDESRLSDKQLNLLNNISNMLGVEASSMLNLQIDGSLYDDTACAVVYSEAVDSPITKVYIRGSEAYINVKMIYDLITGRVIERYPLLDYLIPDWSYGEYITTEQLEIIFDVDFEELFTIKTQELMREPSFVECLLGLFTLDKSGGGDGSTEYKINWKNYDISFSIEEKGDIPAVSFAAESKDSNDAIKSLNGEVVFSAEEAITIPDSLVSQNTVEGFAKVWSALVEILDRIN